MVSTEGRNLLTRVAGVDLEHLDELAGRLARALRPGDLVLLYGPLGAGKTTLIRRIAAGLGYQGPVRSPSFTLANVYPGGAQGPEIHHLDLFRLESSSPEDVFALEEYRTGDAITLVEWPDAGEEVLGPADWVVLLEHEGADTRTLTVLGRPDVVERWERAE